MMLHIADDCGFNADRTTGSRQQTQNNTEDTKEHSYVP
jgi:hypothetical protein